MARSVGIFFEKIVEMFGRIGDALPRFRDYERLFPNHQRLHATLAKVYLDIIIFCVDAKTIFGRAKGGSLTRRFSGKLFWKAQLEKKLENLLKEFLRHQKLAEKEAIVSHMIEDKESRELAKANLLRQRVNKK
jgi:hypothetical protein